MLRIVPYMRGSKSAKLLAEKLTNLLGYKVYRGSPKRFRQNIFWGWHGDWSYFRVGDLNSPTRIDVARNKLSTFKELDGKVPIPAYTTDKEVANGWLASGKTVLARTPTGQGGSGIVVCNDTIPDAPLYTLYIKKKREFRVHVVGNEVLQVCEKRKKSGQAVDTMIRSHRRGWVFCRNGIENEPSDLREVSIEAIKTLGLQFGGVDVIWNAKRNQCYVLEVNTAPGLDNLSAELYANHFAQA